MAGVAMAFAANAQQFIYMMGDGEGLTWDGFPGKDIQLGSDGYYTAEFSYLNSFKISTVQATGWDQFNGGAYQTSGAFGDAVGTATGQTLTLTKGGDANIETPWDGKYTLKVKGDMSSITLITTTPKPTNAPDAYLVGAMNSWGISPQYKFDVKDEGTNYVYTLDCTIAPNTGFKIAGANGSAVNWGGAINYGNGQTISESQFNGTKLNIAYNGNDMKVGANFAGTITLTIPQTAKQNGTISFLSKDIQITYPESLYVIGNVNGHEFIAGDGVELASTSVGVYSGSVTIGGSMGTPIGYFSFAEQLGSNDEDWSGLGSRYGAPESDFDPSLTDPNPIQPGENAFRVNAGTYSLTVSLVDMTLTITSTGGGTDTPVTPGPGEMTVSKVYVVGQGAGLSWDLPGQEFTAENNVVTFYIDELSSFKASVNYSTEWDGDGNFNAGCYGTGVDSFSETGVYPDGQTLPMVAWGENQKLPYPGSYTIIINYNDMTMTARAASPKPDGAPEVYIRGDMNDWLNGGADSAWQMVYNANEDVYTFDCKNHPIGEGVKFKIADMYWGNINYGYGALDVPTDNLPVDLNYDGDNITLTSTYTGKLIFKIEGDSWATLTFVTDGEYDGIEAIGIDEGKATYYDLCGRMVANPDKGIYIRVQNGKAAKVIRD